MLRMPPMQKLLRNLLITTVALAPVLAAAQSAVPLVVVRFNQPRVYYEQQLYSALSKAVAVKPDLLLDVVAYAPQTGSPDIDKAWLAQSGNDAQKVVGSLNQMGVPASRINVISQAQPGLRFDEVHIYVK